MLLHMSVFIPPTNQNIRYCSSYHAIQATYWHASNDANTDSFDAKGCVCANVSVVKFISRRIIEATNPNRSRWFPPCSENWIDSLASSSSVYLRTWMRQTCRLLSNLISRLWPFHRTNLPLVPCWCCCCFLTTVCRQGPWKIMGRSFYSSTILSLRTMERCNLEWNALLSLSWSFGVMMFKFCKGCRSEWSIVLGRYFQNDCENASCFTSILPERSRAILYATRSSKKEHERIQSRNKNANSKCLEDPRSEPTVHRM